MGLKHSSQSSKSETPEVPSRFLYMQGLNDSNQCGKDGRPFQDEQVVLAIVSGMNHSLSILSSGEFVSWGSNAYGQLGKTADSYLASYLLEPAMVSPVIFPKEVSTIRIISVSAGTWHSACISDVGQLFAWGLGTDGQLGINPRSLPKTPKGDYYCPRPTVIESFSSKNPQAVYCGSNYSIVKSFDLKVFSFGNGAEGVLGNGNTGISYAPQEIFEFSGKKIKKIACGWNHCLALGGDGTLFEWGNMLKDIIDSNEAILYPKRVEELDGVNISDIACGDYHSCALSVSSPNALFVWGSNGYGQLGKPELELEFITRRPLQVDLGDVSQVACGGLFTVVKLKDSSVMGWGCNRQRQLLAWNIQIIREPSVILHPKDGLKRVGCGYSNIHLLSTTEIRKSDLYNKEEDEKKISSHHPEFTNDFTCDRELH